MKKILLIILTLFIIQTNSEAQILKTPGGSVEDSGNDKVIIQSATNPYLFLSNTGAATNNKNWYLYAGTNGNFGISTANDSYSWTKSVMAFSRNGDATFSGEITTPVVLINNEIRVSENFAPNDPTIGTFDNSAYGINIDKTNGIGFSLGGVHRMIIKPSGEVNLTNVLVGPAFKISNEILVAENFIPTDPTIGTLDNSGYGINIDKTNGIGFSLANEHRMVIKPNGSVGIGTTETGTHKLAVEGTIGAREIKVEAGAWSDFVFGKDYALRALEEVEDFIEENNHLPDIPSEKEVLENGVQVGEMNAKLLQKIEELTLYLIEQNKKTNELIEEVQGLKSENELLKEEINTLKTQ